MFEQNQIVSHEEFIKNIFQKIIQNPTISTYFISIPEVYNHALIIQLFNEICIELNDPLTMKQNMQNAFSKNKNKTVPLSFKNQIVNFIKNELSLQNNNVSTQSLNISLFNTAALLGKYFFLINIKI
jgi:hypothetical protein